MISNGREFKSCLGRVFNFKLGRIATLRSECMVLHAATSRVENLAQGLSCQLKLVNGGVYQQPNYELCLVDSWKSLLTRPTLYLCFKSKQKLWSKLHFDAHSGLDDFFALIYQLVGRFEMISRQKNFIVMKQAIFGLFNNLLV